MAAVIVGNWEPFSDPHNNLSAPLYFVTLAFVILFNVTCLLGYVFNLCRGRRGLAAVPLYRLFTSQMAYSDYTLKPNPMPPDRY